MADLSLRLVPPVVETERLILRCPQAGDGREVNAAVSESLAELRPWMRWAAEVNPVEVTEANLLEAAEDFKLRKSMRYLIFSNATGRLVGSTGLQYPHWEVPSFEIGYWVRTCFAGQGYITEAVNGLTEMAFTQLGARRMQIICSSANVGSAAVARKAGYQLEGILRNAARHHLTGELYDEMFFSKVR
jgi:ribosomal-protein-serine acetyltransferase